MATESFDLQAEYGKDVTIHSIEIREQPLSVVRRVCGDDYVKGPKKLGKHDYIIFSGVDENGKKFSVVAEKIRTSTCRAGMPSHVRIVPLSEYSSEVLPSRSRFVWDLDGQWTVSTTELNTILTTTGGHYNLFSANCWSYAANVVENLLGLCLCHSLSKRDFTAMRGCMEALERLETAKRPLPRDVVRLFLMPFLDRSKDFDTLRRIVNWCKRRPVKVASSCATNYETNCDAAEDFLNFCFLHSQKSDTNCNTVEVVLYLCLLHSLRMNDLKLARGCEEALQQLGTAKRPLLRDVLRRSRCSVEFASPSARNCDSIDAVLTLRWRLWPSKHDRELMRDFKKALQKLGTVKRTWHLDGIRLVCELPSNLNLDAWRTIGNSGPRSCDIAVALLYLRLRHSLLTHDLELARGCMEALHQLETEKRPLPRGVLRFHFKPLSHQNSDPVRRSAFSGMSAQLKCIRRRPAPETVKH